MRWIRTDEIVREGVDATLTGITALWCVPGSPYASTEGALAAIRWAREGNRPFLGTCGGFQHALMEYCANVLGRAAHHEEMEPGVDGALITKLSCSLAGGTVSRVLAVPGSWYARVAGAADTEEEFSCNYGMAPDFEPLFTGTPLHFVARDLEGQVRAFRLDGHRFFTGTLFQPERRALRGDLHPLVRVFLEQT